MKTGKALIIVTAIAAAAAAGVGLAYVLRPAASPQPTLPGGRTAGAARTAAPSQDPLSAIVGGLNSLGQLGNAVDKLTGGAIGDLWGSLTGGFGL